MLPVALIAGAALGAGEMIYGNHLKKEAAKAAAANVMPKYQIGPEEQQMLSTAESQAGTGMSDAAREALRQNSDRALGTSIDAITRGGGNVNAISSLAEGTQQGLNKMALYEDDARLKHLQMLQEARARMSANRDKAYQINDYGPWANRAQAIAQQQAAAQNTFNSGLNTLGIGLISTASNMPGGAGIPKFGNQPSASGTAGYLPPIATPASQAPLGSPFGMMNEEIEHVPKWNGYSFV